MIKKFLKKLLDVAYPRIYLRTLHNHRVALSKRIYEEFGGTIKYGYFKGLLLVSDLTELTPDYPSMFFGTYEQELLSSLHETSRRYSVLINLGAGDGYYPIGVLKSEMFNQSIAFEGNEFRRAQMSHLAKANNCESKIEIHAWADESLFEKFDDDLLGKSVVLSDIEGGEFAIFNEKNFYKLRNSVIFIEIHDFMVPEGDVKLEKLIMDAENYFSLTKFTTTYRDPSKFLELREFSDNDRWLVVAEGRGPLMTWLRLDPKRAS